jgi:hypothetical protein
MFQDNSPRGSWHGSHQQNRGATAPTQDAETPVNGMVDSSPKRGEPSNDAVTTELLASVTFAHPGLRDGRAFNRDL